MAIVKRDPKNRAHYSIRQVEDYQRVVVLSLGDLGQLVRALNFLKTATDFIQPNDLYNANVGLNLIKRLELAKLTPEKLAEAEAQTLAAARSQAKAID